MNTEAIFWLVVMVIFLIVEMATISLVSVWFVGGSLAAFLVSFVAKEPWVEVLVFLGVSLVLLFLVRPMAAKFSVKKKDQIHSGAQALVGKRAVVTEEIDNLHAKGEVQINGQYWGAKTENDDITISKDKVVTVENVEGVRLIVREL